VLFVLIPVNRPALPPFVAEGATIEEVLVKFKISQGFPDDHEVFKYSAGADTHIFYIDFDNYDPLQVARLKEVKRLLEVERNLKLARLASDDKEEEEEEEEDSRTVPVPTVKEPDLEKGPLSLESNHILEQDTRLVDGTVLSGNGPPLLEVSIVNGGKVEASLLSCAADQQELTTLTRLTNRLQVVAQEISQQSENVEIKSTPDLQNVLEPQVKEDLLTCVKHDLLLQLFRLGKFPIPKNGRSLVNRCLEETTNDASLTQKQRIAAWQLCTNTSASVNLYDSVPALQALGQMFAVSIVVLAAGSYYLLYRAFDSEDVLELRLNNVPGQESGFLTHSSSPPLGQQMNVKELPNLLLEDVFSLDILVGMKPPPKRSKENWHELYDDDVLDGDIDQSGAGGGGNLYFPELSATTTLEVYDFNEEGKSIVSGYAKVTNSMEFDDAVYRLKQEGLVGEDCLFRELGQEEQLPVDEGISVSVDYIQGDDNDDRTFEFVIITSTPSVFVPPSSSASVATKTMLVCDPKNGRLEYRGIVQFAEDMDEGTVLERLIHAELIDERSVLQDPVRFHLSNFEYGDVLHVAFDTLDPLNGRELYYTPDRSQVLFKSPESLSSSGRSYRNYLVSSKTVPPVVLGVVRFDKSMDSRVILRQLHATGMVQTRDLIFEVSGQQELIVEDFGSVVSVVYSTSQTFVFFPKTTLSAIHSSTVISHRLLQSPGHDDGEGQLLATLDPNDVDDNSGDEMWNPPSAQPPLVNDNHEGDLTGVAMSAVERDIIRQIRQYLLLKLGGELSNEVKRHITGEDKRASNPSIPHLPRSGLRVLRHDGFDTPPGSVAQTAAYAYGCLPPPVLEMYTQSNRDRFTSNVFEQIFGTEPAGKHWPSASTMCAMEWIKRFFEGRSSKVVGIWSGACNGMWGTLGEQFHVRMIDVYPVNQVDIIPRVEYHPCDGITNFAVSMSQDFFLNATSLPGPQFIRDVIKLALRTLKPGGLFVATDLLGRETTIMDRAFSFLRMYEDKKFGKAYRETINYNGRNVDLICFVIAADVVNVLEGKGLAEVPRFKLFGEKTLRMYQTVATPFSAFSIPPIVYSGHALLFMEEVVLYTLGSMFRRPGVYFVIFKNINDSGFRRLYIGSSLDVFKRVMDHINGNGNKKIRTALSHLPLSSSGNLPMERLGVVSVGVLIGTNELSQLHALFSFYEPTVRSFDWMTRFAEQDAIFIAMEILKKAKKEVLRLANAHISGFSHGVQAHAADNANRCTFNDCNCTEASPFVGCCIGKPHTERHTHVKRMTDVANKCSFSGCDCTEASPFVGCCIGKPHTERHTHVKRVTDFNNKCSFSGCDCTEASPFVGCCIGKPHTERHTHVKRMTDVANKCSFSGCDCTEASPFVGCCIGKPHTDRHTHVKRVTDVANKCSFSGCDCTEASPFVGCCIGKPHTERHTHVKRVTDVANKCTFSGCDCTEASPFVGCCIGKPHMDRHPHVKRVTDFNNKCSFSGCDCTEASPFVGCCIGKPHTERHTHVKRVTDFNNKCSFSGCDCTEASPFVGCCIGKPHTERHTHVKRVTDVVNKCSFSGCDCTEASPFVGCCIGKPHMDRHPHVKRMTDVANKCSFSGCDCTEASPFVGCCDGNPHTERHTHVKRMTDVANKCSFSGCDCTEASPFVGCCDGNPHMDRHTHVKRVTDVANKCSFSGCDCTEATPFVGCCDGNPHMDRHTHVKTGNLRRGIGKGPGGELSDFMKNQTEEGRIKSAARSAAVDEEKRNLLSEIRRLALLLGTSSASKSRTKVTELRSECEALTWDYNKQKRDALLLTIAHVCFVCQKTSTFECPRCLVVRYCSKECRMKDWDLRHKNLCRIVRERPGQ
jgi:hypothetical protein